MATITDILISQENDLYDLRIENGDFVVGDASEQSVSLLFAASLGEWREHPQAGIALSNELNGKINRFLARTIRVQLEADGFKIQDLEITEKVTLNGEYI